MLLMCAFFFATAISFNCWSAQQNDGGAPLLNQEQAQNMLKQNCYTLKNIRRAWATLSFVMGVIQVLGANALGESDLDVIDVVAYSCFGIGSIMFGALGFSAVSDSQEGRSAIPLTITHDELERLLRSNQLTEDIGRIYQGISVSLGTAALSRLLPAMQFIPAVKFLVSKGPKVPAIINLFGGAAGMAMPTYCWGRDIKNYIVSRCRPQPAQAQAN